VLQRLDKQGPRYTSYPTADRFTDDFSADDLARALHARAGASRAQPLSLYVHLPFCESLCYYCACNKIVTRHHDKATEYLRYLEQEATLVTAELGRGRVVSQLHLGGGTPTFLNDRELATLMTMLRRHFTLAPGGEYAIEIDPRTVDANRLETLAALGFNRLSFGVQDFDPEVQRAVHRVQPAEQVFDLVRAARALNFDSINVDLIYGLPRQTATTFARTLAQLVELRPDRVALYGYAHLPERFKPQRRIVPQELPLPETRLAMLAQALSVLREAGYVHVGMDHFALPDDTLAIARRQRRLHRNFQGYSTQPDCDLIALGVSAIGKIGHVYSQNAKTLDAYYAQLAQGRLPVARGLTMTDDDQLRRSVIMSLMCRGELNFAAIKREQGIDFDAYFADELATLRTLELDGLVRFAPDGDRALAVTELGWLLVRAVAMVFDRHLQSGRQRARFSQVA
jgi:oxygen-independent coproporphyrinogen-3 oxidase